MFRPKYVARAALLVAVAACTGDLTAPTGGPAETISDAAHSGAVPGFYFLPPMVANPSYSGTFDGGLQPTVQICEMAGPACGPVIAQYTTTSGTGGQLVQVSGGSYHVNWHTNQFNLDPAKNYRISVYVGTFLLGFADVDVVSTGKELKNVNTQQYIPLQDDRTLPIKFRIETGIAGQVIVSPSSASIPIGGTQQFTATVLDLHGNPIPGATPAWTSSAPAVATVSATGLATGVSVGSTTITATYQAASGSASLTVFNPNTPPVAVADTFEAIGNVTVPVDAPGVLANDTDVDANTLTAVPGTYATTAGGTVTIAADGSFTYLSPAGFTGTDSFGYTVSDGIDTATGTATVVSAYRVWYVDNSGTAPGDGRDASPFTTLKGAEAASAAGETIFLLYGNGTAAGYDAGIVLKAGQSLTGQGVPANVTATLNGQTVVLLAAGSSPTVTRTDAGATIALASNNVIQGLDVSSTAGAGVQGLAFGTLTAGSMSVAAAGGAALDLENGTAAASFGALTSVGSTGAGLRLVNVAGAVSAPAGSILGAAGAGVLVSGADATIAYGGDVSSTTDRSVLVEGRTGGSVTLSGTIQDGGTGIRVANNSGGSVAFTGSSKIVNTGANTAVELASNAGSSITFAGGGLSLTTTTATAFSATGGGTVTVTGANNTVGTTAGTAVSVLNTTIGAAGLSFRSVSAAGGANGIVLVNTGALNGLQVTGTGVAGSGGSIAGVAGADGTTAGIGVYLQNARSVELSWMTISGASNFGIRGVNVNGFVLANSIVAGSNGDNATLFEGSVSFTGLTGAAQIQNSTVSGGFRDNLRVANGSGVLNRLTISGSTFGANSTTGGGEGVALEASGSAVLNVTVQGSQFTSARGSLLRLNLLGTGQSDLVVNGNGFSNAHPAIIPGAGGVIVESSSGTTGLTYSITGNTFRDAVGSALAVTEGIGSGTFAGTISGNVIGVAGVPNSGSLQGSGISLSSAGGGSHTVAVTGNQVRQYNNMGVLMQIGDLTLGGNGTLNATITGNVVAQPGTAPTIKNGIHLNAGLVTNDNPAVCVDMGGAGALANTLNGSGSGGAAGTDFRLRQRMLTTVRLPGYAGANNDNAAVTLFEQLRNGGTPTGLAQNTVSTGGGGFVGGAGCPQP
jgi:Bacterial Ig domain